MDEIGIMERNWKSLNLFENIQFRIHKFYLSVTSSYKYIWMAKAFRFSKVVGMKVGYVSSRNYRSFRSAKSELLQWNISNFKKLHIEVYMSIVGEIKLKLIAS